MLAVKQNRASPPTMEGALVPLAAAPRADRRNSQSHAKKRDRRRLKSQRRRDGNSRRRGIELDELERWVRDAWIGDLEHRPDT